MLDYAQYIARTLQLARLGEYYVAPNPMVGAVLVSPDGEILSEGWHRKYGEAHAEVGCIAAFEAKWRDGLSGLNGEKAKRLLDEATLFVNLEPCSHYGKTPPCAKMIIEKGIKHVVVGMLDPNPLVAGKGVEMLREAGVEVEVGVMEKECRELNKRFICLHEKHRPYVILKWAQTSDGYLDRKSDRCAVRSQTALLSDRPLVISTPLTKQLVHKMRAENMAILVGSGTAVKDNPKLLTTHWPGRNPIRVLLDRRGRVPETANIFSSDAETIVYRDNTDWEFVLGDLAKRGIHSVMVEGGAMVLNHILETGIWDEMHVEVSDVALGEEGVRAPQVNLGTRVEKVDGHLMYEVVR